MMLIGILGVINGYLGDRGLSHSRHAARPL